MSPRTGGWGQGYRGGRQGYEEGRITPICQPIAFHKIKGDIHILSFCDNR